MNPVPRACCREYFQIFITSRPQRGLSWLKLRCSRLHLSNCNYPSRLVCRLLITLIQILWFTYILHNCRWWNIPADHFPSDPWNGCRRIFHQRSTQVSASHTNLQSSYYLHTRRPAGQRHIRASSHGHLGPNVLLQVHHHHWNRQSIDPIQWNKQSAPH